MPVVFDKDDEPEQPDSQPGHSEPVDPSSRPRLSDSADRFSKDSYAPKF